MGGDPPYPPARPAGPGGRGQRDQPSNPGHPRLAEPPEILLRDRGRAGLRGDVVAPRGDPRPEDARPCSLALDREPPLLDAGQREPVVLLVAVLVHPGAELADLGVPDVEHVEVDLLFALVVAYD